MEHADFFTPMLAKAEAALKEAHERRCETMAMANQLQLDLGDVDRTVATLEEARAYLDRAKP